VKRCDRIIVMDKGRIMEEGPHDELLKIPIQKKTGEGGEKKEEVLSGWYHDLWATQMGEKTGGDESEQGTTKETSEASKKALDTLHRQLRKLELENLRLRLRAFDAEKEKEYLLQRSSTTTNTGSSPFNTASLVDPSPSSFSWILPSPLASGASVRRLGLAQVRHTEMAPPPPDALLRSASASLCESEESKYRRGISAATVAPPPPPPPPPVGLARGASTPY